MGKKEYEWICENNCFNRCSYHDNCMCDGKDKECEQYTPVEQTKENKGDSDG